MTGDVLPQMRNQRDELFEQIVQQIVAVAEKAVREGYHVELEFRDPSFYSGGRGDLMKVHFTLGARNNATGKMIEIGGTITEADEYIMGFFNSRPVYDTLPSVSIEPRGYVNVSAPWIIFRVHSPDDRSTWVTKVNGMEMPFEDILLLCIRAMADRPDPGLASGFRGMRMVPHYEEGVVCPDRPPLPAIAKGADVPKS